MRTILSAVLAAVLILTAAGCGDRGEKNKNKDKDVPKPAKGEPAA
jgi:predicted small lipoprotein YifL